MISRRLFTATVLAVGATAGPAAFADNADTFWERILQAFRGSNRITQAAISATDGLTKSTVPETDRSHVIDELRALDQTMWELFGRRSGFHGDIKDYLDFAKSGSIEKAGSHWPVVMRDVEELTLVTRRIQQVLQHSSYLRQRIEPSVLAELEQSMIERQVLFAQLSDTPAPRTAEELARLENIAAESHALLERTMLLQRSIRAAGARLTS